MKLRTEAFKADVVYERVRKEMKKRMKTLIDKQLHKKNFVKQSTPEWSQ